MPNPTILSLHSSDIADHARPRRPLAEAMVRFFGCRHRSLSRPFTEDGKTYLVCLTCGMRQTFDLRTWQPQGAFYAEPPGAGSLHNLEAFNDEKVKPFRPRKVR